MCHFYGTVEGVWSIITTEGGKRVQDCSEAVRIEISKYSPLQKAVKRP